MNRQQKLDASIAKLDTATNGIAEQLRSLKDEILSGNVTDESLATLDANVTKLEGMGKGGIVETGDIDNVDPDVPGRVVDGTPEGGIPVGNP